MTASLTVIGRLDDGAMFAVTRSLPLVFAVRLSDPRCKSLATGLQLGVIWGMVRQ